jgi:hypothetical protein
VQHDVKRHDESRHDRKRSHCEACAARSTRPSTFHQIACDTWQLAELDQRHEAKTGDVSTLRLIGSINRTPPRERRGVSDGHERCHAERRDEATARSG